MTGVYGGLTVKRTKITLRTSFPPMNVGTRLCCESVFFFTIPDICRLTLYDRDHNFSADTKYCVFWRMIKTFRLGIRIISGLLVCTKQFVPLVCIAWLTSYEYLYMFSFNSSHKVRKVKLFRGGKKSRKHDEVSVQRIFGKVDVIIM